jgi:hypothetical protein
LRAGWPTAFRVSSSTTATSTGGFFPAWCSTSIAYSTGRIEERAGIIQARDAMTKLNALADELAAGGVGVPFFT